MCRRLLLSVCLLLINSMAMAQSVSYSRDIQPIFTHNCVACHACYDAPCQLNLGSGEGVERGASKATVYDGTRTHTQATTRLFMDAHGAPAWRRKDFHSVLEQQGAQAALMARMLELGHATPLPANSKLPDDLAIGIDRVNQCPLPGEFADFAGNNPMAGMPFAVTGLTEQDYQTVQRWLQQGAPVDQQPLQASPAEARQIAQWEAFLNGAGKEQRLVSRWLYEHLFLAHLDFQGGEPGHFFQLVRSRTPSGQAVDIIATRRPNDDPGTTFYYRLMPIQGVIVHKTHITYPLSAEKLARVKSLFFASQWQASSLPGYGVQHRSNPFETFEAIPAQARYQFMLDNAEYFVRTFIRGPVCRGQIATDVIRDNFWVFFQDPRHDLYITDPAYRGEATPLLAMPGQLDEIGDLLGLWRNYRDKRNDYEALRTAGYARTPAPDWSHIWRGNDNALLSIFRQFDSASVRKGLVGEIPQTLWWMDYPLLERTYYQLVVNFDVFGNVSHQAQTRLYFDLIRNGAEQNFLRLMPADTRKAIFGDWYQYSGRLKAWMDYYPVDRKTPSGLLLSEDNPKRQFAEQLLQRFATLNARPDPLNRCVGEHCYRDGLPADLRQAEQALSRLASRPAAQLRVIHRLPEATLLRVEGGGRREVYSLLRNRAHSNVAFMLGEELRYQPDRDTLTLYPEVMTSYPNFLFSVPAAQVADFVVAMEQASDAAAFEHIVERWGIRRTHPQFWQHFHDLTAHIREHAPLEAGVLDMNRYQNL
ncbi:fatty acid cis/trans isomerase [Pseudomonas argentinensis]|uniref:Fatty acid cis/trans isomerase (CTI) n=1 Tax=Phytopseudomonas argentinensis TaxID=289370 RepID=A0A1I3NEV2_9GAMM|nr:fatty acid cis/trans isomerase [Pseudomonas argentinensis]KAB0550014.1 fatty acid cis/trans isomerase [Pseudomonas argentinensis]SFJ07725.1 Fatty acid cis/trans isomerase (CTI) [Pseudomonas argentinensis]